MSLPSRKPAECYTFAQHRIRRLWRAFIASGRVGQSIIALLILVLIGQSLAGCEALRAAQLRADQAEAQAAKTAAYASGQVVSLSLTGRRGHVAEMAGKMASLLP